MTTTTHPNHDLGGGARPSWLWPVAVGGLALAIVFTIVFVRRLDHHAATKRHELQERIDRTEAERAAGQRRVDQLENELRSRGIEIPTSIPPNVTTVPSGTARTSQDRRSPTTVPTTALRRTASPTPSPTPSTTSAPSPPPSSPGPTTTVPPPTTAPPPTTTCPLVSVAGSCVTIP